jgi:hypothetical protein
MTEGMERQRGWVSTVFSYGGRAEEKQRELEPFSLFIRLLIPLTTSLPSNHLLKVHLLVVSNWGLSSNI